MTTALAAIEEFMSHPAPGLVLEQHEEANLPRRVHPTRHEWLAAIGPKERAELHRLVADYHELADLKELYERSNGVKLFYLKCPHCDEPHWALSFLPVRDWARASKVWRKGGMSSWALEECDMYTHGEWRVIAILPSEQMNLVQFFSGEYEGQKLAGKIFCIGLDGYMGFEEELAPSLSALLEEIQRDPAAFFNRLGFSWMVQTDEACFGDSIGGYMPDMRGEPDASPWPATRPPA